jgi:hypothetical protein
MVVGIYSRVGGGAARAAYRPAGAHHHRGPAEPPAPYTPRPPEPLPLPDPAEHPHHALTHPAHNHQRLLSRRRRSSRPPVRLARLVGNISVGASDNSSSGGGIETTRWKEQRGRGRWRRVGRGGEIPPSSRFLPLLLPAPSPTHERFQRGKVRQPDLLSDVKCSKPSTMCTSSKCVFLPF